MGSWAVELATRKAGGIVRVWKGWCGARGCSNPSVLTAKRFGDKKGVDMQLKRNKATVCALPSIHLPLTRDGHGCPKLNAQSFARMRNNRAFIWQGCWRFSRDSTDLEGQCQCSCTGILTKLLMPCQYGKCFWQCW